MNHIDFLFQHALIPPGTPFWKFLFGVCNSYLLLYNALPPNLVAWNHRHSISHSFWWLGVWVQLIWVSPVQDLSKGCSEAVGWGCALIWRLAWWIFASKLTHLVVRSPGSCTTWPSHEAALWQGSWIPPGRAKRKRERMPKTEATVFL